MKSTGFSLLEMLIALAILLLMSGAAIALLMESQKNHMAELASNEAMQNARHALAMLTAAIRQAGNDGRKRSDDSCNPAHHPCLNPEPVVGDAREITLRADLIGSLGDRGDPDCSLRQPFEEISFRYYPDTRELKMKSGLGRFDPIAQELADVRFLYYRYAVDGRLLLAERPCAIQLVRITVVPSLRTADPTRLGLNSLRYEMTVDVHIRSRGSS